MNYFRLKRTQLILACFLATSLLLFEFPGIDLRISQAFYARGFPLSQQWWTTLLNGGVRYFIVLSMISVVGIYAINKLATKNLCSVDGKKVLYLFLVLIVGAGLIVNVGFKDNFGRARPRDIQEFGGPKHFTAAFVVTHECRSNCSFSSGHGAGAFFALALAMALSRRRAALLAALAFGFAVSLARITSGAHFLSDTVISFFVMLIVSDALYFYLIAAKPIVSDREFAGKSAGVRRLELENVATL